MGLGRVFRRPVKASARVLAAGAATLSVEAPARAGFLQPEGTTQVITSGSGSRFSRQFDAKGRLRRAATFSKANLETWVQNGLNERLMLVARFGQEGLWPRILNDGAPVSQHSFVEGGARVETGRIGDLRLSAQLMGGWRRCACGPDGFTVDARLIAALPFKALDRSGFAEVQAGYRHGGGVERSEFRLDATLGGRPWPDLLLLTQVQLAAAPRVGEWRMGEWRQGDQPYAWRVKAEAGAVLDVTRRVSVQLGVFTTLAGRNAARETGVRVAIWTKLGPIRPPEGPAF